MRGLISGLEAGNIDEKYHESPLMQVIYPKGAMSI